MASLSLPDFGRRPPLLPTHVALDGPRISRDEHQAYLKAKYEEADVKLVLLEEELEALIYFSRTVRDKRMKLVQGRMEYSENVPRERNIDRSDELMDEYLALAMKNKVLDDVIAALKVECSDARNDCTFLFAKYRAFSERGFKTFKNMQSLNKNTVTGLTGNRLMNKISSLDDHGAMDRESGVERMLERYRTASNVGAVMGGLGSGIAFTTLFSATRGRLDLIAWAFTSFIFVVFISALFQSLQTTRGLALRKWARQSYSYTRHMMFWGVGILLAFPFLLGIVLLVLAVALLDGSSQAPVTGSQTSIRVAGSLTLGWIAIFTATGLYERIRKIYFGSPRSPSSVPFPTDKINSGEALVDKMRNTYPSHILPRDFKWSYLPGGADYFTYRKWRHVHVTSSR